MGSVGFVGEDEYQPSTSNGKKYKLSRKLVPDSSAINYALVPRKLRSAIKKQRCELVTQPLPVPWEQNHVSNRVAKPRKLVKKSKPNMKKGRVTVTKAEKEVAETLYALADMFSDATKFNKSECEHSETKSSTIPEVGSSTTVTEDMGNVALKEESKILVDSTSHIVKVQPLTAAQQTDLGFEKQSDTPNTCGVQSDLRQKMPSLDMMIPSGEQAVAPRQVEVVTPNVQHGNRCYYPKEDRSFGSYQSPSSYPTRDLSSKSQGLPPWLETAICTSMRHVIESSSCGDKSLQVGFGSKTSWRRSTTHAYVCRLINVLQMSKGKEGLQEKPSGLTAPGGAQIMPTGIIEQKNGVMSSNGIINSAAEKNSTDIQNAILLHKRLLQDQQLPFKTTKGSDFSSLGNGAHQLDDSVGINGVQNNHEALRKIHTSYLQSQNHLATPFSLPRNGYLSNFHGCTSAAAAQQLLQVQLPPYLINSPEGKLTATSGQLSGSQQQQQQQPWLLQLQKQSNHVGVDLAEWKNGRRDFSSRLNYAQPLHSNYQQQLAPPQQQFTLSGLNRLNYPFQLHNHWCLPTPTNL